MYFTPRSPPHVFLLRFLLLLIAGCRCVCGGGHRRPHPAEDLQEVQENQKEAQGPPEAVDPSAECPTHCHHHRRCGLCGGGHRVVVAVGLHL